MGKINSKRKGASGEREVAKILREHGYTEARRTAQYCGNTGDAADVVGLDDFHTEVKRCETTKIWEWLAQAERDCNGEKIPIVVFRKSRTRWKVAMDFEAFLDILETKKTEKTERFLGGRNEQE